MHIFTSIFLSVCLPVCLSVSICVSVLLTSGVIMSDRALLSGDVSGRDWVLLLLLYVMLHIIRTIVVLACQ